MAEARESGREVERPAFFLAPSLRSHPSRGRAGGGGHLRRAMWLAGELGPSARVLVGLDDVEDLEDRIPEHARIRLDSADSPAIVVTDRRRTSGEVYDRLRRLGPVVGLDDDGPARDRMAYLIDMIPGPRRTPGNVFAPGLLDLPGPSQRVAAFPPRKVLITFGLTDPKGLTTPVARGLHERFPGLELTVVKPPAVREPGPLEAAVALEAHHDLKSMLADYDLIITSFGLTSLEALAAGVPVLLVNATRYHRRLAVLQGIPEAGVRRPRWRRQVRSIAGSF